jgi:hypothetical protein
MTEHPNLPGAIIQECFDKPEYYPYSTNIRRLWEKNNGTCLQVEKLLNLLRQKGVLDKDIAYSLEL